MNEKTNGIKSDYEWEGDLKTDAVCKYEIGKAIIISTARLVSSHAVPHRTRNSSSANVTPEGRGLPGARDPAPHPARFPTGRRSGRREEGWGPGAAIGGVVGGAPRAPGWGGGGDDGGENPAGRGGAARTSGPGCGGARGASAAEGGGRAARTVTSRCRADRAAALPSALGARPEARPRRRRPLARERTPAASAHPALPSARSSARAASLAGPRRDGVGTAPQSRAMGRPLGAEQPPEA